MSLSARRAASAWATSGAGPGLRGPRDAGQQGRRPAQAAGPASRHRAGLRAGHGDADGDRGARRGGRVSRGRPGAGGGRGLGWGENRFGEAGNGTQATQANPVPVALPGTVVQLAANGYNGAAVLASGQLATWGSDSDGQIGDSRYPTARTSPFVVPGLPGITQVAVGANHVLALDSTGTVWAWGNNNFGELGNGTLASGTNSNPLPARVPGLTGVTQIAAGTGYSVALRSDGTVWAWGRNNFGQLGDGTTQTRLSPEQVPGLTGITRVYAGLQDSYAIGAGGTVRAWGDNLTGLLGLGTAAGISARPATIPGLTGVTALSSAYDETLAVTGPAGHCGPGAPTSPARPGTARPPRTTRPSRSA